MSQQRAAKAKEKGNKLFKDGLFAESAKSYAEAEKFDGDNPVFSSNLSAALFELGDYQGCANAILRSWALKPEAPTALKLLTRLPKALSHGIHDGTISTTYVEEKALDIKALAELSMSEDADSTHAWALWKSIQSKIEHYEALSHEARIRFSRMPIYKCTPDPSTTYFVFGTDDIISLVDNWSANFKDPIDVQSFFKEGSVPLSFMLAGVGDARHVFGTLIGLGSAQRKLRPQQKPEFKAHLTLLDIHFATIARDLLLCMLIHILVENQLEADARLEVQTTLVYVYIGWAMPDYCSERMMWVIKDLIDRLSESPPRLPSWLHVDVNSIKPVLRAFQYWLTDKSKTTAGFLKNHKHMNDADRLEHMQSMNFGGLVNPLQGEREAAGRSLDRLSDRELRGMAASFGMAGSSAAEVKAFVKLNREKIITKMIMAQYDKNPQWGLEHEAEWYKGVKVFMPPVKLWHKHPGFETFRQISNLKVSQGQLNTIAKTVNKTWKPNITLLDGTQDGYTEIDYDAFGIVRQIGEFNNTHGIAVENSLTKEESPAFSYVAAFFERVVGVVKTLQNSVQLEFICGEINTELAKVRLQTDSRPASFPKQFTRIWLSNIPDYTNGTLNTALYVLPALQNTTNSAVSSNCMWNSPLWKSDEEFCYNYTLLLPKDLQQYLAVRTLNGRAVMDQLTLGSSPLPRPLSSLASRDELRSWLTRLFISIVSPGNFKPRPDFVKLPNTLVVLVGLLGELKNIGYPSHWLADFMLSILNGTLVTDRMAYRGTVPRPISELSSGRGPMHRIRTDPWLAEFEAILASSLDGLPFALQMPKGLAAKVDDIGYYKSHIEANMLYTHPMFKFPGNDAIISLLFYKDIKDLGKNVNHFLEASFPTIVDGNAHPVPGSFHVLTSPDYIDLVKGEVRWRMSKAKMAKMRREKWTVVAWRTDFWAQTTEVCPAGWWENIDSPV